MSNSFEFGASNGFAVAVIGGLPIAVIDREASAQLMIRAALAERGKAEPALFVTSANGQVISDCARDPQLREQFLSADLIHADGMPLVFASRFKGRHHLPERVATTDLFHDVARLAESMGASFYLLGASAEVMEHTVARVRALYPRLDIVGYRDGYMSSDEEAAVIDAINAVAPDILWIGMGVPREIFFSTRHRDKLTNVGLIKTAGGLFDFISGKNSRAPGWMQATGFEWLYRLSLEPKRLFRRYARTNLHAAYLLLFAPSETIIRQPTGEA
jgi:N-acetylglucosaminyldiphosphoundecaprenol N-acetyl-beta-D-mannosaminyltransferase